MHKHVHNTGFCHSLYPSPDKMIQKYGGKSQSHKVARAAFLKGTIWPQKYTIKVCFIRDSNFSQSKLDWVKQVIEKYIVPLINLSFQWDVTPQESDIRITFDQSKGAYSAIGNQALQFPKDQETMNLGWLDTQTDYDSEDAAGTGAVVIHEFGHCLGMIHEHSRADAPFNWNKPAVYASLEGPPNNWSKDMVDQQVFIAVDTSQFNGSDYDKTSIMHYYFPENFFNPPFIIPHATKLSNLDIEWIHRIYDNGKPLSQSSNGSFKSWISKNWWIILISLILIIIIIIIIIYRRKIIFK